MKDRHNILVQRRIRYCGVLITPGSVLHLQRLRVALHLVRTKQGRPADRATALDVELAALLLLVIPRQ